jgi:microcystin degradation protein MlrC
MRVFTATLGTETNTFSPLPTGLENFLETLHWPPGSHPAFPTEVTAPLWAARERRDRDGWQVIEGTCTFAQPAGITARRTYESLRDQILQELEAAGPVDIVAFGLHGAMLAHGYPDVEADLLQRARALAGPKAVIGALLDPHCHLTADKLAAADVLVCFKEYPHTDYVERARELLVLLERTVRGEIVPVMEMFDCRMLAGFVTTEEPMRSLVQRMCAEEGRGPILSVSLAHGFPAGDTADTGARMLVVADRDRPAAASLAAELGRELYRQRAAFVRPRSSLDECLRQAIAEPAWPVVVAETSDNCGGGDAGDSAAVLRWLLAAGVRDACLGPLWDPIAVQFCLEAGEGALPYLRIGGKCGPQSGAPLDVHARVRRLAHDGFQTYHGARIALGATALVEIDGVQVVLCSQRQQALATDLFTNLGVDLAAQRLIVVKSAQQFRPAFESIARRVFYLRHREGGERDYRHVRRPIWPLDTDPLGLDVTNTTDTACKALQRGGAR